MNVEPVPPGQGPYNPFPPVGSGEPWPGLGEGQCQALEYPYQDTFVCIRNGEPVYIDINGNPVPPPPAGGSRLPPRSWLPPEPPVRIPQPIRRTPPGSTGEFPIQPPEPPIGDGGDPGFFGGVNQILIGVGITGGSIAAGQAGQRALQDCDAFARDILYNAPRQIAGIELLMQRISQAAESYRRARDGSQCQIPNSCRAGATTAIDRLQNILDYLRKMIDWLNNFIARANRWLDHGGPGGIGQILDDTLLGLGFSGLGTAAACEAFQRDWWQLQLDISEAYEMMTKFDRELLNFMRICACAIFDPIINPVTGIQNVNATGPFGDH